MTTLTDVKPLDKWQELVAQIEQKSPLRASVYNPEGIRIADGRGGANELCAAIKATDKGQAFICAVAHMNLAKIAQKTGQPVVEECDAGLLKIVVPVFAAGNFIGAVGGCGLLSEEGEADPFMISKTIDMDEEKIEALSQGIGRISSDLVETLITFIQNRIEEFTRTPDRVAGGKNI